MLSTINKLLIVGTLFTFALACGSGKSNSSATGTTSTLSGTLNFDSMTTGLQKTRQAATDTGTLSLTNLDTSEVYTGTFTGESFSATLRPGSYKFLATRSSDGTQLRSYLPTVSEGSNANVMIDLDTTTAAVWVDTFNEDVQAIDSIVDLVRTSDSVLQSASSSNTQRDAALMVNFIKKKLHESTLSGSANLTAFQISPSQLHSNSSANLLGHLSGNIYLSSGNYSSTSGIDLSAIDINALSHLSFKIPTNFERAVVFGTDYTSGAISIIDTHSDNIQHSAISYSTSDINIFGYGRHLYTVGRFGADFVEKRDLANPSLNLYGVPYSTLSHSETSSLNPHSLIFESKSSALLTRYGSSTQWFVDPSARQSSQFLKKTIDLKAYDTNDQVPEITSGAFVNGQYYVVAQRLDQTRGWVPSSNAYMIVLDALGQEVNTGKSAPSDNLFGIELPARNPSKVVYRQGLNKIFIQCTGSFGSTFTQTPREFTGGIVTVDPSTYEAQLLIDDDNGANLTTSVISGGGTYGGLIHDMVIASDTKGYLMIYDDWQKNTLRPFNPTTGVVGDPVIGFDGIAIGGLEADHQGRVWILTGSSIKVIDSSTDAVVRTITGFDLPPTGIKIVRY